MRKGQLGSKKVFLEIKNIIDDIVKRANRMDIFKGKINDLEIKIDAITQNAEDKKNKENKNYMKYGRIIPGGSMLSNRHFRKKLQRK